MDQLKPVIFYIFGMAVLIGGFVLWENVFKVDHTKPEEPVSMFFLYMFALIFIVGMSILAAAWMN